jgi:hypothetical protein
MALTKANFIALAQEITGGRITGDRTLTLSPMLIGADGLVSHDLVVFGENQLGLLKPNIPYLMTLKEVGTAWGDSFLVMVNDAGEVEDASHLEDDE